MMEVYLQKHVSMIASTNTDVKHCMMLRDLNFFQQNQALYVNNFFDLFGGRN